MIPTSTPLRRVEMNSAESAAFSIVANAKVFKIMMDQMYSRKFESIMREICSNAHDSHIAAGCPERPFRINFPTHFDPMFRVRDFGVSLSHEDVMGLYTKFGFSTKEADAEQNGMLGMGSKVPFAYSDTFQVTAYLNGEMRVYSAIIGEVGVPMINLMGRSPTDQENGLEVSFPVNKIDFRAFEEAARRVAIGFEVLPEIENDAFVWENPVPDSTGDGWALYKQPPSGLRHKAYAHMGCVIYPIDVHSIEGLDDDVKDMMQSNCIILKFDMGELAFTSSREDLSYKRAEPTMKSLLQRSNNMLQEMSKAALDEIASANTYWDACVALNGQMSAGVSALKEVLRRNARWNGKKVVSSFLIHRDSNAFLSFSVIGKESAGKKTARFEIKNSIEVKANNSTFILVEDTSGKKVTRSAARVRKFYDDHYSDGIQVVWFRFGGGRAAAQQFIEITERMDGVEIIDVADLAAPPAVKSYNKVKARSYNGRGFGDKVTLTDDEVEEGGLFIPFERNEAVRPSYSNGPETVYRYLCTCDNRFSSIPVYGAPKTILKYFEGEQWTNLYDAAKNWLDENVTDIEENIALYKATGEILRDRRLRFLFNHIKECDLADNSLMHEMRELMNDALDAHESRYSEIEDLNTSIGNNKSVEYRDHPFMTRYADVVQKLMERYPIIMLGAPHYGNGPFVEMISERAAGANITVDIITEYVTLQDNSRAAPEAVLNAQAA